MWRMGRWSPAVLVLVIVATFSWLTWRDSPGPGYPDRLDEPDTQAIAEEPRLSDETIPKRIDSVLD